MTAVYRIAWARSTEVLGDAGVSGTSACHYDEKSACEEVVSGLNERHADITYWVIEASLPEDSPVDPLTPLEKCSQALADSRRHQDLYLIHGVDCVYLEVADVDGDWIETW